MSSRGDFWAKTRKEGDCLTWIGCCNKHGFGIVRRGGKNVKAHRVAWEITYGEIPQYHKVRRKCGNTKCVNPEHLEAVFHRRMLTDSLELEEKFWMFVEKADGCWLWTGGLTGKGYGRFVHQGSLILAHRLSWEMANGESAGGLHVCHRCDNPKCINPDHLFLGTHAENMADKAAKGRARKPLKLNREQVLKVFALKNQGLLHKEIAKIFGVSQSTIGKLLRGKPYADVYSDIHL